MKGLLARWRMLLRRAGAGALLLIGLQAISIGAPGVNHGASDEHSVQLRGHHYALDWSLCLHRVGGTGSAIHCHKITAAARAIVPEWSPDPRDTVSDDGVVLALPRAASTRLPPTRALPAGPPAFILFANFRS